MKKTFKIILSCILIVSMFVPMHAFALTEAEQIEWTDIDLSSEEFETILSNNLNPVSPMATGLIDRYSISISKRENNLVITGLTQGTSNVVKCGFKKVTIQRRANSSSSWSDYQSYSNLYKDSTVYNLSKTLTVPSGYQYRVTCTHYAKKSLLSTQKLDNTSNVITM